MQNAQIQATKDNHAEAKSVVKRTMTAKEMKLSKHSLNRDGSMARLADGSTWVWDDRFDWWACWKLP